ncbi:hypothetical protein AVEN_1300-1 [Araneus ventricosus]|uniref:Uncharacterized protein n=1 Tax=Araneus ventricosus TaxID=182803 RepID=A0A4Y2JKB8_ARAVE|nr:hypothetical protein AVEN_1300-1 [Araneus ventricosus]
MLSRVIKQQTTLRNRRAKRTQVELTSPETAKRTLKVPPSANDQMRKETRLVVGSRGQQRDKSLRLNLSATPHRSGRRSL